MTFQNSHDYRFIGKKSPTANPKKNTKRPPLTLEQLEARMLMAIDLLDQQLQLATSSAMTSVNPDLMSTPMLVHSNDGGSNLLASASGTVGSGQRIITNESQVSLQVLKDAQGNYPRLNWTITSTDPMASGHAQQSGGTATLSFSRPADYKISVGTTTKILNFNVRVIPTLTSLGIFSGQRLLTTPLDLSSTHTTLTVAAYDQINKLIKLPNEPSWSVEQGPAGAQVQFQNSGNRTRVIFDRAGQYILKVNCGNISTTVQIKVAQVQRTLTVTPSTSTLNAGQTVQLTATALDQFQRPMETPQAITWTTTGGNITASGLFTGSNVGTFRVTARVGTLAARVNITVQASKNDNGGGGGGGQGIAGILDSTLRSLVTTFYADNSISREEMIQILRAAGTDSLTATELSDLRYIVSSTSTLKMPQFVRVLGSNVVTNNPANLRYQGQAAGNLAAGSSSFLVNNLVDKWFMGADTPTLTSHNISYRTAVGSLFPTNPGLNDSQQGMLGDCYFLASMISIANKNADAVRNMFIENSDGTVTIRFFAGGKADYVTVNRNLPTLANGTLAYSGSGRSVNNASTPLWLALAEKAYAQWNETGKAGRDGTNSYAGIEGGWMGDVNAQILGYGSSNYAVNGSNKQSLINSLNGGSAVTIGTTANASTGGLVGSHAYVVTGYNASTDSFSFYNPWSTLHPTALTWNQMVGQFSYFVVASPNGSGTNGTVVSNSHVIDTLYTYVESCKSPLASSANDDRLIIEENNVELIEVVAFEIDYDPIEAIATELYASSRAQPAGAFEAQSVEEIAELVTDLSLQTLQGLEPQSTIN